MRQFLSDNIDQLDLALEQLIVDDRNFDRFVFMLIDNMVELTLHKFAEGEELEYRQMRKSISRDLEHYQQLQEHKKSRDIKNTPSLKRSILAKAVGDYSDSGVIDDLCCDASGDGVAQRLDLSVKRFSFSDSRRCKIYVVDNPLASPYS